MALYVGVDPGKKGAIAVLDQDGRIASLAPMPIIPGGGVSSISRRSATCSWETEASAS